MKLIKGWEIRLGNVGSATGVINLLLQHDWEKTSQTEERARSQGHIFHPYVTAAGIANQSYNKVRALAVFTHPKPSASVQNSEISVEKKNPNNLEIPPFDVHPKSLIVTVQIEFFTVCTKLAEMAILYSKDLKTAKKRVTSSQTRPGARDYYWFRSPMHNHMS